MRRVSASEPSVAEHFRYSQDGQFKLKYEREPPSRVGPNGPAPALSCAPPRGEEEEGSAVLYNVADHLHLIERDSNDQAESVQLRERVACHDLHWCGGGGGKGGGGGGGAAELEAVVALSSGEVLLWRPPRSRDTGKAAPALTPCLKELAEGVSVTALRWRPLAGACFAAGLSSGRVALFELSSSSAASGPRETPKRTVRVPALRRDSAASAAPAPRYAQTSSWQASGAAAAVNALAFSADGLMLAAATADGRLAVIDVASTEPVVVFRAYYGALLCCCWSDDGRYLLSGGEDDLITVWSIRRREIVCRGEGHRSWVHAIAFDPAMQPSEERGAYRFVSVGADTQLLVWEFQGESTKRRSEPPPRDASASASAAPPGPLPYRAVPIIAPLSASRVHLHPLSGLLAGRRVLLTSCVSGVVRTWFRPEGQHKC